MKKIITRIDPFSMQQRLSVWENETKVYETTFKLTDANTILKDVCLNYFTNDIIISGPYQFTHQIGNKLKENFAGSTFAETHPINISYIE